MVVSNVAEFAVRLPLGVQSPAGENGSSLSGGQRQRVSIARALIKNAPVLCLDEPTAALDTKSENYIRDSLMQMINGKTVLMVTHRKSLLTLMDTIYVLENGQLTNVNELGGLDYYLGVLEGIDQQAAVAEIEEEQQYVSPEMINAYLSFTAPAITEDSNVHREYIEQPQETVQPKQPEQVAQQDPNTPTVNDKGEVEIKLH